VRAAIPLLALLTIVSVGTSPAEGPPPFAADEIARIHWDLDRRWPTLEGEPEPARQSRELCHFALEAAGSGWHPDRLARILDLAAAMQDRNPTSETYGNFRWSWGQAGIVDRNAAEFCMTPASLIRILYEDRLPRAAKHRLRTLLTCGAEGIRRHGVGPEYTNIYLLNTWCRIALGETLGQSDLADDGYARLDRWLLHTRDSGVTEYLSPTYTGVAMDALALIAGHARRVEGRANARAALALFWEDLAANWFPGAQRLGGAHSRDYDLLFGRGRTEIHVSNAGWMTRAPAQEEIARSHGVYWALTRWLPDGDPRRGPAGEVPRFVFERWSSRPGGYAASYVGKSFCLGSAGSTYGDMDKPLTMSWAGDSPTPAMSFFISARGQAPERFSHLTPFLMSVQDGPEVLMLASVDRVSEPGLVSQMVLPAMDEIRVGETLLPASDQEGSVAVPEGAALVFRRGDVALGVKIVLARVGSGGNAPARLVFDGERREVFRLVISHSDDAPQHRGQVVLFVRAEEGLDESGVDAFRESFARSEASAAIRQDRILATAQGRKELLHLEGDLATSRPISVVGLPAGWQQVLLSVNGRELGRPILEAAPALRRH
jgi:hypothetical protein